MRICNLSIIKHLKQNVKYIWMCFFNLIKKKYTIWIAANTL